VPSSCTQAPHLVLVLALGLAAVAAIGTCISFRTWRNAGGMTVGPEIDGRPRAFLAGIGALRGALFTSLILVQGAASFFFSWCER
jgi:hypothetical protein